MLTAIDWLGWLLKASFRPISGFDMPFSLSSIISSFELTRKECDSSFHLFRGHCIVINRPDFSIMIMKKFEILARFLECNTETGSVQIKNQTGTH